MRTQREVHYITLCRIIGFAEDARHMRTFAWGRIGHACKAFNDTRALARYRAHLPRCPGASSSGTPCIPCESVPQHDPQLRREVETLLTQDPSGTRGAAGVAPSGRAHGRDRNDGSATISSANCGYSGNPAGAV